MSSVINLTNDDLSYCELAFADLALEEESNGKFSVGDSLTLCNAMKRLERFLDAYPSQAFSAWLPPGETLLSIKNRRQAVLHPELSSLPAFVRVAKSLPNECCYSPGIEIFRSCVEEFLTSLDPFDFGCICHNPCGYSKYEFYVSFAKAINLFAETLYQRLSAPETRKKILDQRRSIERNITASSLYITRQFDSCARLLVLRLDLGYKKGARPDFATAEGDLARFFANRRHNRLFLGLRGYVVKVEFGIDHGIHFHLLLFFDGSIRAKHADAYLCEQLGEYWNNTVTKRRGRYWNGNSKTEKEKYAVLKALAVGKIHATDEHTRSNILKVIKYFCKKEQFFKPKTSPKAKLLRKGAMPSLPSVKRGRPRQ